MHELSLAGSILQLVEDAARREPFHAVRTLHLRAPALCGVDVSALRFALASIAPGSLIAEAELLIDQPPVEAWCEACGAQVQVEAHGEACPHCHDGPLRAVGDAHLRVVDLVVE